MIFLGAHSEGSDTGHLAMGEGQLNQETASAKVNIEEHVGLAMAIQQLLEELDGAGKIVSSSL